MKLPAASRGASLAQLEVKLRRPLLEFPVTPDVALDDFTHYTTPAPSARASADKGDFPVPLITPSAWHAFIPAASRGAFGKGFRQRGGLLYHAGVELQGHVQQVRVGPLEPLALLGA